MSWRLKPIEIAVGIYFSKLPIEFSTMHTDEELIRFYANHHNLKPPKMDLVTIDDLKAAGFDYVRYIGTQNGTTAQLKDDKRLAHNSVPPFSSVHQINNRKHPIIEYRLGHGWSGWWGAMELPLRNDKDIVFFCEFFEYPVPNNSNI